ncbi:MAG TPA: polyphosphate kinase 2 [Rhizomicrobium sp.]|nr:polyphosphate kinase 2 [Rhizomicrobium sp.]
MPSKAKSVKVYRTRSAAEAVGLSHEKVADRKKKANGKHGGKDEGEKLSLKQYTKQLRKLQVELCYLQDWVKATGARIIILFEGRDAAGKGGIIKAITERVSPRVFRLVALPAPSDREKTEMFMQRYIVHFPAGGEIVIMDRSWYNRAGVEYVMKFCTDDDHKRFLELCPVFERWLTDAGIILIKIWLEVGMKEQERRFEARIKDPLRQWKLSPMDLESFERWYDYSNARDQMLEATDRKHARWHILNSNDKKRARLNGIAHILSLIPYTKIKKDKVKLPKRAKRGKYDDALDERKRHMIPAVY